MVEDNKLQKLISIKSKKLETKSRRKIVAHAETSTGVKSDPEDWLN